MLSTVANRSEGKSGTTKWLSLYLLLLLFAPPLFQSVSFVSRGVKLDQILILLALPVLAVAKPGLFKRVLLNQVAFLLLMFWLFAALTGIISFFSFPDSSLGTSVAALWGQLRPWLVFTVVYIAASDDSPEERFLVLRRLIIFSLGVFVVGFLQFLQVPSVVELTSQLYGRKQSQDFALTILSVGRVYGTFDGQPNAFGTFAMMIMTLLGVLSPALKSVKDRLLFAVVLASAVLALALSWSRGAYAGALVSFLILTLSLPIARSIRLMGIGVALIIGLYAFGPAAVHERFLQLMHLQSYGGTAIYENRLPYWEESLRIWASSPALGVLGIPVPPSDNLFIALLTTNGLLGLLWFLAAITLSIHWYRRLAKRPYVARYSAIGMTALTVGMLVNGISSATFFAERVQELYWFLAALVLAQPLTERRVGGQTSGTSQNPSHIA